MREKPPEGFQRAEFLLEKGAIDLIVDRREMKRPLAALLALLQKPPPLPDRLEIPGAPVAGPPDPCNPKGQAGIELAERVARVKARMQERARPKHPSGDHRRRHQRQGARPAPCSNTSCRPGYRTGCCHLAAPAGPTTRRVRLDRQPVDDACPGAAFARRGGTRAAGNVALTYFEFGTLAAWWEAGGREYRRCHPEVGLGGRLDAVNVHEPDAAIVTGIAHRPHGLAWPRPRKYRQQRRPASSAPASCHLRRPAAAAITASTTPRRSGADLQLIGRDFGHFGDKTQWTWGVAAISVVVAWRIPASVARSSWPTPRRRWLRSTH